MPETWFPTETGVPIEGGPGVVGVCVFQLFERFFLQ